MQEREKARKNIERKDEYKKVKRGRREGKS